MILALLLRHREVISSDTLSNYVHVWFVADQLWHGHGLPFHMPVLAHGDALAFPVRLHPVDGSPCCCGRSWASGA